MVKSFLFYFALQERKVVLDWVQLWTVWRKKHQTALCSLLYFWNKLFAVNRCIILNNVNCSVFEFLLYIANSIVYTFGIICLIETSIHYSVILESCSADHHQNRYILTFWCHTSKLQWLSSLCPARLSAGIKVYTCFINIKELILITSQLTS